MSNRRKPINQSKHDRTVMKIARDYEDKGYEVKADVSGFSKPGTIGGYRPDITAKKGSHLTIVEVETTDSVSCIRDLKQKQAFSRAAKSSNTKHFRRKII